jgi:hypothetical protein
MAKICRNARRIPDALIQANQLRETTPTEKISPPGLLGIGRGAENPNSTEKYCYKI